MPAHRPSYPRPVADAPVAALADGAAVAKAWLLELVAAADLAGVARVAVADLAREGPALCAALVAALGSETAVPRLAELAPRAGALAGATDPADAIAAVEALRRGAWECLATALPRGEDALATDLALRLSHVTALVAAGAAGAFTRTAAARVVEPEVAGRVEARDARSGPAVAAIDRALEHHLADGSPFAVLLVEVDDLDRLVAAGGDVDAALDRAGRAVAGALGPGPDLVHEHPGRAWALVPGPAGAPVRRLAESIAGAIAATAEHRGTPLSASVGVAACPQDGSTAGELLARAEEGIFAARAAGIRLAPPPR